MAVTDPVNAKRLGRPPDTDSADTRRRILDIARVAFANSGFDATTNREISGEVGITTGALYHYFGSKLDLYLAVQEDVQAVVYGAFTEAVEQASGFRAKLEAVLDTAHELNKRDPTLAAFVGVVRADMRRHPEIAEALADDAARRTRFFVQIVDDGIASGEIAKQNRQFVIEFVDTILIGLTDGVSDDAARHLRAITAIKMVLRGELVNAPSRR